MTLTMIDVEVPTDRLPSVNGAEAMVQTRAKLLPAPPPVRPHPGDELDVRISDELAVELAIGDLVVLPASAGRSRTFEIVGPPRDGWVRARPARDKHTPAAALAEANARDADLKRAQQRAANERLERTQEENGAGLELLRDAGFPRTAEALERNDSRWGYELGLDACLREDVAAMGEREAEAAAT
jgi:hypothetical protein